MKKVLIIVFVLAVVILFTGTTAFAETKQGTVLNNPFNIKKSKYFFYGRVSAGNFSMFESFQNITFATAAFYKLIRENYYFKGYNTIEKIMYRYAPPNDGNDTEKYISYISNATGFNRSDEINISNFRFMSKFAESICFFESGYKLQFFQSWRAYQFYLFYY
jgi:hypothetical protein